MTISEDHYRQWEAAGYLIIEDFVDPATLEGLRAAAAQYVPTVDEYFATPLRYERLVAQRDFPFVPAALNDVCVHPDMVEFAERVLGTPELMLTHGLLWAKYSGENYDQKLHSDYGNNTLTYPRDDGEFQHLTMILYLSDVTEDDGPTYFVPREFTRDLTFPTGILPDEDAYRALYEHERPVTCPAGSLLIYSPSIVHRGSAIRGTRTGRLSLMIGLRRAGFEWMGHSHAFAKWAADPHFGPWLESASPRQRQLIGFPAPGHAYWTEATLHGVASRYPGMDMTPYRAALG